ncbi:MAG: MBL fold metallo-hydrolase, partial [Proteobacteria bacterium]|nr:MBL fold metallo-hydrolase [Pseudomonadota bacterium]
AAGRPLTRIIHRVRCEADQLPQIGTQNNQALVLTRVGPVNQPLPSRPGAGMLSAPAPAGRIVFRRCNRHSGKTAVIELFPDIFYVPGENNSSFPYCACLYLRGRRQRVLIDAGMGSGRLAPLKRQGIDALLLTHSHVDHHLTKRDLPGVPIWCHQTEAPFMGDQALYLEATGIARSGFDVFERLFSIDDLFDVAVSRTLIDGDTIDLGGLTLVAIHTPGHTPGHLAFFIPEYKLLFAGDIDLTPFGPFYGHDFADIEAFIASIRKLKALGARVVATGHGGPFTDEIGRRFDDYERVIYERDARLLAHLSRPHRLEDLEGRNLIYPVYPDPAPLIRWFELVTIHKHLDRLERRGKVRREGSGWVRS